MIRETVRLDGGKEMIGQCECLFILPVVWNVGLAELRIRHIYHFAIDILNRTRDF